jgi:hypothetical protein
VKTLLPTLALALVPVPAHAHAPGASVELDRDEVKIGQTVTVRLSGWPSGNVSVELCGNEGRRGSADCAVTSSATTHVNAQGGGSVLLNIVKPPVGCPCVVSARPVGGGTPRTVPITVKGAGTLTAAERAQASSQTPSLTVTRVALEGGGPVTAWLGGSAERTFVYTVRNDGQVAVTDAPVTIMSGRSPDPTGLVTAPAMGTLNPGEERTFRVPVRFGAPALGDYQVTGRIEGLPREIVFTAETSSYPWAWPLLGLLFVAGRTARDLRRGPEEPQRPAPVAAGVHVACPHCSGPLVLRFEKAGEDGEPAVPRPVTGETLPDLDQRLEKKSSP